MKTSILSYSLAIVATLFFNIGLYGQTGPGGVGNNSGAGNLKFWLRGDSVSIDTGVDTLYDLSGYNHHFVQSTTSYQPSVSAINGFNVLEFDGSGDFLSDEDGEDYINGQSAFTLLFMIKSDLASTDKGFFIADNPAGVDDTLSLRYDITGDNAGGSDIITAGTGISGTVESSAGTQASSGQLVSYSWTSNSIPKLFIDGAEDVLSFGNIVAGTLTGSDAVLLGKGALDINAGDGWDGIVGEVIYYNKQLNEAERTIVENYLSARYDIAISTDQYTTNPAGFIYDLSGIGVGSDGKHNGSSSAGFGFYEDNSTLDVNGEYAFAAHDNTANDIASIQTGTNVTNCGAEAAWARDWYLQKTGNIDMRMFFDVGDGIEGGGIPQNISNYRLLYKANPGDDYSIVSTTSQGIQSGDQVYFEVADANIFDGYYTLGTIDQTNSPVEGSSTQTWYTLVGGSWNTPGIWTLDPSGSLPDNPENEIPDANDNVVILSGKTVTISDNNKELQQITVNGRLELGTTTGHDFTVIKGSGRMVLEEDNFPDGDATHFVTEGQGEGTVIYSGSSDITLTTTRTFYTMEVLMDNSSARVILVNDYTLNGNLKVETGILQINNDASTTPLILSVDKDVNIFANGAITVGTANAYTNNEGGAYGDYHEGLHQMIVNGDFTNQGSVRLTNLSEPNYTLSPGSAGGAASLVFTGAENNTFSCEGTTDLYNLVINKGIDRTYELELYAGDRSYFSLFGNNANGWNQGSTAEENANPETQKALWIQSGSLRLTGEVYIPTLNEGGRDFSIGENAGIILDDPNVFLGITANENTDFSTLGLSYTNPSNVNNGSGSQGLYVLGKLQVNNGKFLLGEAEAINFRDEAAGIIEINGGEIEANQIGISSSATRGDFSYIQTGGITRLTSEYNAGNDNAILSLRTNEMVFSMSGGEIIIEGVSPYSTNGILIASAEGNYNVSGGQITIDYTGGGSVEINSSANFHDFVIENGTPVLLQNNLVVSNDITIRNGAELDADGYDLSIGGDFNFEDGATYTTGTNNTRFIGGQNSTISIGNTVTPGVLDFNNLVIEKARSSVPSQYYFVEVTGGITTDRPIDILDSLTIIRGQFDVNSSEVDVQGDISITDGGVIATNPTPGHVVLNGSAQQTLQGSLVYTPNFGRMELDNSNGAAISTDLTMDYFIMTDGIMDIGKYRLTIDTNMVEGSGFGTSKMINTNGSSSARGLRLYLQVDNRTFSNETIASYPVGAGGRYGQVDIDLDGNTGTSVDGYYTVIPVDEFHPAISLDRLDFYWKTESTLSDINDNVVELTFDYDGTIPCGAWFFGCIEPYLAIKMVNNNWSNHGNQTGSGELQFNGGNGTMSGFISSEFTAASSWNVFDLPRTLYSTGNGDWDSPDTWDINEIPRIQDFVVIREGDTVTKPTNYTASAAKVTVNGALNLFTDNTNDEFTRVDGYGTITMNSDFVPANSNFDDFMNNDAATFEYVGGGYRIPSEFAVYPNLRIAGTNRKTLPNNLDILVQKNLYVKGPDELRINNGDDLIVLDSLIIRNSGGMRFGRGAQSEVAINKSIDLSGNGNNIIYVQDGNGNSEIHKLNVYEDIILSENSSIDLYNDNSTDVKTADIYFLGNNNSEINDAGGATLDLNRLIIDKAVHTADVEILESFTLNGATDGLSSEKALYLQRGDLTINNGATNIDLTTGGGDFKIPSEASLSVLNGTVNVSGANTGISLDGYMQVGDGSQWLINGGTNNYIEYSSSGNARIDVEENGTLRVGSQIRRPTITTDGVLKFSQNHSNSTVIIGETDAPEGNRGLFEILNTGSEFTQAAGANITIVRQQASASAAALYLDPETVNIGAGASFTFGDDTNTPVSQVMGVNSTIPLKNIFVNSTNAPQVQMQIRSLTLEEDLNIESGGSFDANGLDLTIEGDLLNAGTFVPNGNTTYFNGSTNQQITGNTDFYNLVKSGSNDLFLSGTTSSDLLIENEFSLHGGTFSDSSNNVVIEGDVYNNGTHLYGGSGVGLELNGSSVQNISGDGVFGKLTISNVAGANVETGNEITITNALSLNGGVLDVGSNFLNLGVNAQIIEDAPFSNSNMIRTNSSFTDNGVRKTFPSTADAGGAYDYTIPIGSGSKYTPVLYEITNNGNSSGTITTKAANEPHPSITEDSETPEIVDEDNVLQYHWVLKSSGVSNFSADVKMTYEPADVFFTSPYDITDYITARLLNDGSGEWNKFTSDDFDESQNLLIFNFNSVNEEGIEGDYTAGIDDAIPDEVPFYETNQSGSWTNGNIWTPNIPGGPRGARVRINTGDTVHMPGNFQSSYTTTINGRLEVDSTYGHRLGEVDGTGTLYTKRASVPAGYYESFLSASGGTLEYGGSGSYDILSTFSEVNNLKLSGTGQRRFPNQNVTLLGDLIIEGDDASLQVINENDKKITIAGNIDFIAGSFDAGSGAGAIIEMNGTEAQEISGDFTAANSFNHFVLDNSNGLTFTNSADIYGDLSFSSGIISLADGEVLKLTNQANTINGAGSSAYVDGILSKALSSGSTFTYPIGDNGRYASTQITNTQPAGISYFEVEYFDANPITDPMTLDPSNKEGTIELVSEYEYWRVTGPASGTATNQIRWDDFSILPAMTSDREANLKMAEWSSTNTQWEIVPNTTVNDGGVNSGTIVTDNNIDLDGDHYFTLATTEGAPLPAAGFLTQDTTICAGSTITLRVQVTGNPDYEIDVDDGTPTSTYPGSASPITFDVTPGATITYTITEVTEDTDGSDGGPVASTTTIFGDPVTVTVLPVANNTFSITPSGTASYCAGESGVEIGLDNSESNFSYELLLDGSSTGNTVNGTGSAISFGNQTDVGLYTIEGTSDSDTEGTCTQLMSGSLDLSIDPLPTANDQTADVCSEVTGENAEATVDLTSLEPSINGGAVTYTWYEDAALTIPVVDPSAETITKTINGGAFSATEDYYVEVDDGTCTNVATVIYTIFRTPETGPQYHISNTFGQ